MIIKVAANQKHEPHKCKICGKFIAWRDLGISAVKESDRYLAEFVHIACASRRAKTLELIGVMGGMNANSTK